MDLRDFGTADQPTSDQDLNAVAARIRPLPANIVPSERFMEKMRARLLGLTAQRSSKAA
jgi:hypothetical protein